ncbi:hypothetical protein CTI12_AA140860 [Artemisia annua]|uniref:Uncharacterized protein n=1 Tax=Artemisia annua TaxID=35608 RepID=A0A2U1PKM7_ARTAN|nr:hypothetical protein CTI12_AA140860 [Artemisia annua]
MGNCIKKQPAIHPSADDFRSPKASAEENFISYPEKIENYSGDGENKAKTEIKIKISKKQLEELLGRTDVQGLTVEQVLAQLMNVSDQFEAHQRLWRPALQSIPE